jgi:formiminotetrahydrofolate cyclodeaminase
MPESTPAPSARLVAELTDGFAQGGGYPAGGAVAALVAAMAASLIAAAADRSREEWDEAAGARAQAQALVRRAAVLVELEQVQYAQARLALQARQEETEAPDEIRDWALGLAIRSAAAPPLELAATAADIAELASTVAARGAGDVRPDAVVAATLAASAARSAAVLVQVNLVVGGDSEDAAQAVRAAEAAAQAAAAAAAAVS